MDRRPRLLHLTTTDMSLELLLGPQLSAFIEAGYDVHGSSAAGEFVEAVEARGVTFHELEHSTRSMSVLADLRAAREFWQLCRRLRPDIVHTHNPKPGVYGRIAAKLAGVPRIVNTVHGLYAQPTDPFVKKAAVYGLERIAATFSDVELVQNEEDIPVLVDRLRISRDKVRLLGNGVDLERFRPRSAEERVTARAQLGFSDDDVVIGAVGRLVVEKGYVELLEAFGSVADRVPNARLMIIGGYDPEKADSLPEDLVEQAKANGVIFLGHRNDVEDLYCAMDLYVLASHREGFPRSAMEAAANGLPIIATDIRGCRQVVEPGVNGQLVAVNAPSELAGALCDLAAGSESLTALSDRALAKAVADFDQTRVIRRTLASYLGAAA